MTGISVIVPLFNKANFIEACVASVLAQSWQNFELIIVDDGSTDHSLALLKTFQDDRIVILSQSNSGVSAARNTGIAAARNDYCAFLDADDLWLPDHLAALAQLMREWPSVDLWSTGYVMHEEDGAYDSPVSIADGLYSPKCSLEQILSGKELLWTSALMVRRQSLLALGGFRQGYNHGEDNAVWIALLLYGGGVAVSHKVTATYRRTASGLTGRLVKEPDACMRAIEDGYQITGTLRESLMLPELLGELYNKFALAHAIGAMIHGDRDVAQYFLSLAAATQRFRRKRQVLSLMSLLSGRLLSLLARSLFLFAIPAGRRLHSWVSSKA